MNSKVKKFLIAFLFYFFTICNLCKASTNIDSLKTIVHSKSSSKNEKYKCFKSIIGYYIKNQLDSAFVYAKLSIENAETSGNVLFKIEAYVDNAQLACLKGEAIKAVNYSKKALSLAKSINDSKSIQKCYNALGIITSYISDYDGSLNYYYKSLAISERLKDSVSIIKIQNNIAILYVTKKDYDMAESIYLKDIEICKRRSNKAELAIAELNLGSIYLMKKQYRKAINYFNNSLAYLVDVKSKIDESQALINLGDAYAGLHEYNVSLEFIKRSSQNYIEIKDQKGLMNSYISMASILLDMNQDAKAYGYLKKAWAIQNQLDDQELLSICSELLYKYYKKTNQAEKALHFYEVYIKMKDSINGMETQNKFHQQEIQYQLNKQHQADSLYFEKARVVERIERKSNENRKKLTNSILLISLIVLVFFGSIFYRLKVSKNKAETTALLNQIQMLKTNLISNRFMNEGYLKRENIESQIDFKLNITDWRIVEAIYQNPVLTNKEIAEKASVSYETVRSSLKKMYTRFLIDKTSRSQKASLIIKLIELSQVSKNS